MLAAVIDVVPDILLLVRVASLRFVDVNRRAGEIFGYSRGELLDLGPLDLLPEYSRSQLSQLLDQLFRGPGQPLRLETVVRRKNGSELAVDVRFAAVREPDGTQLVILALRDIHHRVQIEEQLKEANGFLDAIVENVPDMIFVKDGETLLFERFNRAGEELLGWKRSELLGKTDHDFYPKEQADFFHAKDRETLRGKKLVDIPEEPIETKAHGLRWLHTRKVPILDEDGNPRYLLGISEDITARKLSEERMHALERELASVVRDAREAIVAWTLDGAIVSFNPSAEQLYGLSSARAIGLPIESLVPESVRHDFRKATARVLAGEKLPLGETFRLRQGQEIEIEESLFAVLDPAGKPVRLASLARDVSELKRLRRATEILGGTSEAGEDDLEVSRRMRETLASADAVAQDAFATVLLLGETGVGKSWLARRIHARSPRAHQPFFEVNCASLGGHLAESELFGHERGAFTGATTQKRGIVEVAEGGSLFLDEIGDLPPPVQAKLLTFLENRSFRRLGGTRTMIANVRLIAATNVQLKSLVDRGGFRADLYYRLSVVPIEVPPLRERREEIAGLARSVLHELARRGDRKRVGIDRKVTAALRRYDWPGNVRELRNALERALIVSRGEPITVEHLPPAIQGKTSVLVDSDRLDDMERGHILRVLRSAQGNRTRAAELLGISRSTLKRKLAELRLEGLVEDDG
jgi:PAS domain S-box-containing protein